MQQLIAALPLWGLVFARTAGVALLVPPIGVRQVPIAVRIAAAAIIATPLCWTAGGLSQDGPALALYGLWVARNLAVGLVLGGAVAAILWAAVMAGAYMERGSGWSSSPPEQSCTGSVFYLLAAVLFVLIDGHHAVFQALVGSFKAIPVGPPPVAGLAMEALVLLPARMFAASLMIAGPALLVVLLARALLAAAERLSLELAISGLNAITAPLLATVALVVALPAVAYVILAQFSEMLGQVATLLQ